MNALPEEKKPAPKKKKPAAPKAPPLTPEQKLAKSYEQALAMESWIQWADSYVDKASLSRQAAEAFEKLGDYEDCPERKARCLALEQQALGVEREAALEEVKAEYDAAKTPEDFYYVGQKLERFSGHEEAKRLLKQARQRRKRLLRTRRMTRRMIGAAVCLCLLVTGGLLYTGRLQYAVAGFYYSHGQYDHALEWYLKVRSTGDAEDRITDCRYQRGLTFSQQEKYTSAYKKFRETVDYQDSAERGRACLLSSLASAQPGSKVTLGKMGSSFLKWMVLENDGAQVKLIAEFGDEAVFDSLQRDWTDSDLRAFLNGEWCDTRLSALELPCLLPQREQGDLVTLLSAEEFQTYDPLLNGTGDDGKRIDSYKTANQWWLITPGTGEGGESVVIDGAADAYGRSRTAAGIQARPVIVVQLQNR